jgi:hypothetical protein
MTPTSFEDDLRERVDAAFTSLRTVGVADAAISRGRARVRRRRVATVAGAVVVLAGVSAGTVLLTPGAPEIAPMAPGEDATDGGAAETEAAREARARAEEAATERAEAAARVREERIAEERARVEDAEREVRDRLQERVEQEEGAAAEAEQLLREAEPVTGYGDFSDVDPFELDTHAVTLAIGRCVADGGFDVTVEAPGNSLAFHDDDATRNHAAQARQEACVEALQLPEPKPPTEEQHLVSFAYQLAVHACLVDLGYDLPAAPSEPWPYSPRGEPEPDAWMPYSDLLDRYPEVLRADTWDVVQMACPQGPIGGFGAWSPGDPVPSVETLPTLD